jgi:hypothetical protein
VLGTISRNPSALVCARRINCNVLPSTRFYATTDPIWKNLHASARQKGPDWAQVTSPSSKESGVHEDAVSDNWGCCHELPNAPLALAPTPKISGVALHICSSLSMPHPVRKTFQSPDWGIQK